MLQCIPVFCLFLFLQLIIFYDAACFKRFEKYKKKYLVLQCIPVFCLFIFLQLIVCDAACVKRLKNTKILGVGVYSSILFVQ